MNRLNYYSCSLSNRIYQNIRITYPLRENKQELNAYSADGFLEPQSNEGGEGIIQDQEHDGIDKVVPLQLRVDYKLPGV